MGNGTIRNIKKQENTSMKLNVPRHILPVIFLSLFGCSSLWFAGNGIMTDLIRVYVLAPTALGHLTAAVQFGFITGTLLFALLTIADRYSPSRVFFLCATLGAICNLGMLLEGNTIASLVSLRFITGFFLAGIYPVGMKIAADYVDKGLGKSLGFLVGALVLGTSMPHLLNGFAGSIPWQTVILATSLLSLLGGLFMLVFVPDGPFQKPSVGLNPTAFLKVFREPGFRASAFGYFGHMWELYAFWTYIPFLIESYSSSNPDIEISTALTSFFVIGIGGPACVMGGYLSNYMGTKRTAALFLGLSCCCCLLSPFVFNSSSYPLFSVFLLFWGAVVIADSPLFSALVANNAHAESKGTALTIVNCIGYAITIVSIQLLNFLRDLMNVHYIYMLLALGPVLGLLALCRRK
jgi:MFS family permease